MMDSGGLVLQVCPSPEDDAGELADLARLLRGELLDLDVSAIDRLPDEAVPPGAKGLAAIAGWLAVQLGPEALRAVLAKVADWATRNNRAVEVSYGGGHPKAGPRHPRAAGEDHRWLARPAPDWLLTRQQGRARP